MTCAHVVDVALRKVAGVESVEVSLNKSLATVRLKLGNAVSVAQLWQLLHEKGYTPKATVVSVRGEVVNAEGRVQFKVTGTKDVLALAADAKNPAAYPEATANAGKIIIIQGVMLPGKDLKAPVPLQVGKVN
jgi:copper chaperone CopZ